MKPPDPMTLLTIAIITVAGLTASVVLLIWAPSTVVAQGIAALFTFLGPIVSILLLILQKQVAIEHGVNGTHAKQVQLAERVGRLEERAGVVPPAPITPPIKETL